jgi:hypothetical protein
MSNIDKQDNRENFEAWAEQVGALPWGHLKKQRTASGNYSVQIYTYMWNAWNACTEALLDELEAAEKRIAELEQQLIKPLPIGELLQRLENQTGEPWGERYLAFSGMQQDPVAWRYRHHNGLAPSLWKYVDSESECNAAPNYRRQPLYTTPPTPVVPDEMSPKQASRSYGGEVHGYRDGWNACRAAMLKVGTFTNEGTTNAAYGMQKPAYADIDMLAKAFKNAPLAPSDNQGVKLAGTTIHGAESVSSCDELPLDYLQGHKDGLEWAAQLAEANHPQTGDWLYDDPIELAKAIRKGPDMPAVEAGNSPVIPDGWVMVPVVPTEHMVVEGFESEPDEFFSDAEVWEAYDAMSGCQQAAHRAKLCWAAMIAAVPKKNANSV